MRFDLTVCRNSDKPTLLRSSKAYLKNRVAADKAALSDLERSGDAFTNMTAVSTCVLILVSCRYTLCPHAVYNSYFFNAHLISSLKTDA